MDRETSREALSAHLAVAEALLAFAAGHLVEEEQPLLLGFTPERLILLRPGAAPCEAEALTVWREHLYDITWVSRDQALSITLPGDALRVARPEGEPEEAFLALAQQFAWSCVPARGPDALNQRAMKQAQAFETFGLARSAQTLRARNADRASQDEINRGVESEKRIAMRVVAAFSFLNVIPLTLAYPLMGEAPPFTFVISGAIDLLIAFNLWQGRARPWVTWAIIRMALSLVVVVLGALTAGYWGTAVPVGAQCIAVLILLTGRPHRIRTWIGAGILIPLLLLAALGLLLLVAS